MTINHEQQHNFLWFREKGNYNNSACRPIRLKSVLPLFMTISFISLRLLLYIQEYVSGPIRCPFPYIRPQQERTNKRIMNANIYRSAVSFESIVFGAGHFFLSRFSPFHVIFPVQFSGWWSGQCIWPGSRENLNIIITFQFQLVLCGVLRVEWTRHDHGCREWPQTISDHRCRFSCKFQRIITLSCSSRQHAFGYC